MSELKKIYMECDGIKNYASSYLTLLTNCLKKIDTDQIKAFVKLILETRENGGTIYFIGNGGSAATADHFANDLSIGTRSWDRPLPVISLCGNQAIITAIANDYGYEFVFEYQLKTVLKSNDIVVAISASGNSKNLVNAVQYANNRDITTVSLTAFDGGILKSISSVNVHVPTANGDYGPAEDGHMILDHLIGSYLTHYFHIKEKEVIDLV